MLKRCITYNVYMHIYLHLHMNMCQHIFTVCLVKDEQTHTNIHVLNKVNGISWALLKYEQRRAMQRNTVTAA